MWEFRVFTRDCMDWTAFRRILFHAKQLFVVIVLFSNFHHWALDMTNYAQHFRTTHFVDIRFQWSFVCGIPSWASKCTYIIFTLNSCFLNRSDKTRYIWYTSIYMYISYRSKNIYQNAVTSNDCCRVPV